MRSGVNLALISVRSSSPSSKWTVMFSALTREVSSRRARRRISIHSCSRSNSATWSKSAGSNSACSSRLRTCRTLRLNSAVTPCESS